MSLTPEDRRWILQQFQSVPTITQIDAINQRLDGIRDAILHLADNMPGSVPGQRSHLAREAAKKMAVTP